MNCSARPNLAAAAVNTISKPIASPVLVEELKSFHERFLHQQHLSVVVFITIKHLP
jgi:hypothetical protein